MRTKVNGQSIKFSNKIFTSIDNQLTRSSKSTQANNTKNEMKENRNSHAYVTSPYDQTEITKKVTFEDNCGRGSPTQRPTMGGKTISAINKVPNKVRMSSEELKLLSRRIDPSEPLATPHSSPSKPPLPSKKRLRNQQVQTQPTKSTKTNDDAAQFTCEPCNKKYKTRSGFIYHTERCKYQLFESNVIIQCICQNPTSNSGTLIECVSCNTWLHTKCIGSITNEASFHCLRCTKENGSTATTKIIKLSELCPSKKIELPNDHNGYISLFSDVNEPLNNIQLDNPLTPPLNIINDFSDWTTEPPSLSLSDNSSPLVDFSSSELLLSPTLLPQSDWFHFANFEVDFQQETTI